MPGIEKLHLEDTLEESPQTRNLLGVFEKDYKVLRGYTQGLHKCCHRIFTAQREMAAATQSLSAHLKAYETQEFLLEGDDSILMATLKQFSVYIDELSSINQILATQLGDGMMFSLNRFLQADLDEISNMSEMSKLTGNEHEQSMIRYMKLPKKKDNEKIKREANDDLYGMRKKHHQTSLHYFSTLNTLQYKKKYALLDPLVSYLYAQKAFMEMGKEATAKTDVDDFLSNINASIQGVQQEMGQETQRTVEMIENIEKQSIHKYHAEPRGDMPFIPPNTTLSQKAGYLFFRSKQALITTRWDRFYFFIQGGNLMCQGKEEVAGKLVLDLNEEGTHAEPADADDRRYVFHVISPVAKKTVYLQAENNRDRDEWVATLNNAVKDGGYIKEKNQGKVESDPSSAESSSLPIGSVRDMLRTSQSAPEKFGTVMMTESPSQSPSDSLDIGVMPDAPIQFDIITPTEGYKPFVLDGKDGPPKRINPFDQASSQSVTDNSSASPENAAFSQTFVVRFLGSMEVKRDRGEQLVNETIRQIMAARAIHNVFKTTESHLSVSNCAMRLIEPSTNTIRTEFKLEDISYWSAHKENERLLGFITRTRSSGQGDHPTFACHVFECNTSAEEICLAISTATKLAYQTLMDARQKQPPSHTPNKQPTSKLSGSPKSAEAGGGIEEGMEEGLQQLTRQQQQSSESLPTPQEPSQVEDAAPQSKEDSEGSTP